MKALINGLGKGYGLGNWSLGLYWNPNGANPKDRLTIFGEGHKFDVSKLVGTSKDGKFIAPVVRVVESSREERQIIAWALFDLRRLRRLWRKQAIANGGKTWSDYA